jgi:hypothetical protein
MPEPRKAIALLNPPNQQEWMAYIGPIIMAGIYISSDVKGYVQLWDRDEPPSPGTPHPFAIPVRKDILEAQALTPPGILFASGIAVTISSDANVYTPLIVPASHFHVLVYGTAFLNKGTLGPGTEILG